MVEPPPETRSAELRAAVKEKYRAVSRDPTGRFPYPVGRESAFGLGYEPSWLDTVPGAVVDGFVGVGNPFRIRRPGPGEAVLDLGCGLGLDVLIAALLVGGTGRSVGIDLTPEMVERARILAGDRTVEYVEGSVERMPFEDASFDQVITNGVINLVPDKAAAFREIARVLKPGGTFATADLLVVDTIPPEVLASKDAWST